MCMKKKTEFQVCHSAESGFCGARDAQQTNKYVCTIVYI